MLTPAEVLKQNAQMVQSNHKAQPTDVSAMRQVLARFKGHPWKLWHGYFALLGRNLPSTAIQFPLFEFIRSKVIARSQRRKEAESSRHKSGNHAQSQSERLMERAGLTAFSASISGSVASIITTPIDVIKTRVMLSASDTTAEESKFAEQSRPRASNKKGTWAVGKQIFRDEGIRGLFRGGAIRSVWTALSLSLYLGLYEGGRFYLENRRRRLDGDA